MIKRGFKEVYQIDGGIVRYGMEYKSDGLWEGSLFMFDGRMTLDFSDDTKIVGKCEVCDAPTKDFYNCARDLCHRLILLCSSCAQLDPNKSCTHKNSSFDNSELVG
jgi:UPF0176 protein